MPNFHPATIVGLIALTMTWVCVGLAVGVCMIVPKAVIACIFGAQAFFTLLFAGSVMWRLVSFTSDPTDKRL